MPEVKLQGFIGINSDDEYVSVPQPDTVLGENIVMQSVDLHQSQSVKPRRGDLFEFEIPPAEPSSKIFEIRSSSENIHIKIVTKGQRFVLGEAFGTGPDALLIAANELDFVLNQYPSLIGSASYVFFNSQYLTDDQGAYIRISIPAFIGSGGISVPNPNRYYDYDVVAGNDEDYNIVCVSDSILPSMAGELSITGRTDFLGNTFCLSAVENKRPFSVDASEIRHVSAYYAGPNLIASVTTVSMVDHGLQTGEAISISIPDNNFYSGIYTVTVVDENTFLLNGYPYVVSTASPVVFVSQSCVVTYNPIALGEIGVYRKNSDGQGVYTKLLRSGEFNFRTIHQIDVEAESTVGGVGLYFADGNNDARVFYYSGDFVEDGALSFVNPANQYVYGNIAEQVRLVSSSNSLRIRFVEQLETGGNLSAGNKAYAVRGLSAALNPSFWSDTTGPINVFSASSVSETRKIKGNTTGAQTTKVNVLEITGIDTSLFSFIEIAVVEYLDSGYQVALLDRIALNGREVLRFEHDGNEEERQILNSQELNIDDRSVTKPLNISILDNRLLLSNFQYRTEAGLSAVLDTVKYELKQEMLPKQGLEPGLRSATEEGLNAAEYQLPINVSSKIGYMTNETYLFAARFVFKNGFKTKPVVFCTVKFDTNPISEDGRRLSGLPSYDTIQGHEYDPSGPGIFWNPGNILVNNIEFSNFNFNAIVDGVPARDLIERIDIMRAEVTRPTVLGCGIGVLGIQSGTEVIGADTLPVVRPNPYIAPISTIAPSNVDPGYEIASPSSPFNISGVSQRSDVISVYIPDALYRGNDLLNVSSASNKIIVLGSHQYNFVKDAYVQAEASSKIGGYIHYGGNSGWTGDGFSPVEYSIEEAGFVSDNGSRTFNQNSAPSFVFRNSHFISPDENRWLRNYTFKLSSSIPPEPTTTYIDPLEPDFPGGPNIYNVGDRGLRYVQIYRPNPDQYNDVDLSSFVYTLSSISPSEDSVVVFGGDCFVQRTTIKLMVSSNLLPVCLDFYSHNRINVQMRGSDENIDGAYPMEFDDYDAWILAPFFDELAYSRSYSPRQEAQAKLAYNPNLPDDSYQPTGIVYSNVKTRGAVQDSYRTFAYADFTSLDTTYGPITFMKPMNGELFTIQHRRVQRQFFNTRGVLSTSDGATALIGDGAAFYRDGSTVSSYGCMHKWSVVPGRSFGGNDVWYWYDAVNRAIIRFGADGIVPLSIRAKFRAKLRELTELAIYSYTPADCFGISGVWDEFLAEVVWTFRLAKGYKGVLRRGMKISAGDLYSLPSQFYDGVFEEIPVMYRALYDHVSSVDNDIDSEDPAWEVVEYGDERYMKFFALVFSEAQNRFISVDDIYPKIYLLNNGEVYYPRVKSPIGAVYKRNAGVPLVFFDYLGDNKQVYGAVESVFNLDPNIQKKASALRVYSELVPHQIEVRSEDNQTFIIASDFTARLNQWDAPISNDTPDIAGRFDDNGAIFGTYIRVKFIFAPQQSQRLVNMVLKFKPVSRNYNT
jgi:hypothetical protein